MIHDLVFHLGDRKTGSTSIQRTLSEGLWQTEARRVYYTARDHNGPLANALLSLGAPKNVERRFTGLAKRMDRADAECAVVSSETFEDVSPAALKSALETHMPQYAGMVRLIAYVRPHGARVLSGYSEQIKRGQSTASLEQYFAEGVALARFTSAERFARWKEVFGDAFTLRPMIRDRLHGNCVVRDFLHYTLGSSDFDLTWEPDANPSLGQEDLALLQRLHTRLAQRDVTRSQAESLGAALGSHLADSATGQGTGLALSPALAQNVITNCREDATALDAMFFKDTPMRDALENLTGQEAGQTTPPDAAAARTMDLFSDWVGGL